MNPFDLRGPDFLLFYFVLAIVTVLALHLWRRSRETGPLPSLEMNDPYLFAYLQGGVKQVLQAATVSLVDRGLLIMNGEFLNAAPQAFEKRCKSEIESGVLEFFRTAKTFQELLQAGVNWEELFSDYEERLQSNRLLPDAAAKAERSVAVAIAILVLAGIAVTKIVIALSRGRTNIGFLILLSVMAVVVAAKTGVSRRTVLGDKYLAAVRNLYSDLRGRSTAIQPGGASTELLWLTALFGIAAVPTSVFPFVRDFRQRSWGGDGSGYFGADGGGGGCGSSGGCGGGCGGCGG